MLLTDSDSLEKNDNNKPVCKGFNKHPQNVPDCSLYQVQPILQIPCKSFHAFFRNVTNRHTKQTNKRTEIKT